MRLRLIMNSRGAQTGRFRATKHASVPQLIVEQIVRRRSSSSRAAGSSRMGTNSAFSATSCMAAFWVCSDFITLICDPCSAGGDVTPEEQEGELKTRRHALPRACNHS